MESQQNGFERGFRHPPLSFSTPLPDQYHIDETVYFQSRNHVQPGPVLDGSRIQNPVYMRNPAYLPHGQQPPFERPPQHVHRSVTWQSVSTTTIHSPSRNAVFTRRTVTTTTANICTHVPQDPRLLPLAPPSPQGAVAGGMYAHFPHRTQGNSSNWGGGYGTDHNRTNFGYGKLDDFEDNARIEEIESDDDEQVDDEEIEDDSTVAQVSLYTPHRTFA